VRRPLRLAERRGRPAGELAYRVADKVEQMTPVQRAALLDAVDRLPAEGEEDIGDPGNWDLINFPLDPEPLTVERVVSDRRVGLMPATAFTFARRVPSWRMNTARYLGTGRRAGPSGIGMTGLTVAPCGGTARTSPDSVPASCLRHSRSPHVEGAGAGAALLRASSSAWIPQGDDNPPWSAPPQDG
jgi:hypothetical protein